MTFNFLVWDFGSSPYDNMVGNIIYQNGLYNRKAKDFKEAFTNIKDGENIGKINIGNWFHNEYGNQKPLCLWDKLMREIGRMGTQIYQELDIFNSQISDELSRTSERIGNEIQRELDSIAEVGEKVVDSIKDAYDDFEDFIKDPCFLTTATLNSLGVCDDDCYELTLIRKVRDNWLINEPKGKEIIAIYKRLAPKIVDKIGNDKVVYLALWDLYIEPFLILLENEEYNEALDIYITMVCVLKAKYGI